MAGHLEVETDDGRALEVMTGGDPAGFPWLFWPGSPSAAVRDPHLDAAAAASGLRLVSYARPGYGASTPRAGGREGPRMADDVTDAVTVLDRLGLGEFVTLGWSGGGPRALACGALLPGRCRAVATLAGVAPVDGEGLDWFDGMAPENRVEYDAAQRGPDAYLAYLEAEFAPVLSATADELAAVMGELLTATDARFLPDFGPYLAESFQEAGAQGLIGVRDDGLAAMAPWGFDLSSITVPVAVWQGREDAMVPYAHGEWLAAHVPGAERHFFDDEGHISLLSRLDEVLDDLRRLAGL